MNRHVDLIIQHDERDLISQFKQDLCQWQQRTKATLSLVESDVTLFPDIAHIQSTRVNSPTPRTRFGRVPEAFLEAYPQWTNFREA